MTYNFGYYLSTYGEPPVKNIPMEVQVAAHLAGYDICPECKARGVAKDGYKGGFAEKPTREGLEYFCPTGGCSIVRFFAGQKLNAY